MPRSFRDLADRAARADARVWRKTAGVLDLGARLVGKAIDKVGLPGTLMAGASGAMGVREAVGAAKRTYGTTANSGFFRPPANGIPPIQGVP